MKIMYTGPRDIHVTPALERARYAVGRVKSEEVVVDWNDIEDSSKNKYAEYHFKAKKTIFNVLRWQLFLFKRILKFRPNVIFNMSVLSFPPLLIYSFFFKVKLIYDCRDYLAVSYNYSSLITATIRLFDNISALHATAVVIPDDYGREYFYMLDKSKLHVVYNSVKQYGLKKKYIEGPIRLAYFGYLSYDRNIKAIFDFIEKNNQEIELHIACNYIPETLKDKIPKHSKIILYERKSHYEAQKILATMDYCILTYNPDLGVYKNIQPTKFYDCLALGLPYICSKGMTNLEKHVNLSSNLAIEYDSIEFKGIKKTEFSEYNHQLYLTNYVYDDVCKEYRSFIEAVI